MFSGDSSEIQVTRYLQEHPERFEAEVAGLCALVYFDGGRGRCSVKHEGVGTHMTFWPPVESYDGSESRPILANNWNAVPGKITTSWTSVAALLKDRGWDVSFEHPRELRPPERLCVKCPRLLECSVAGTFA